MLASKRNVGAREIRIGSHCAVDYVASFRNDPVPQHSHRDIVLHFACIGAGVTANATIKIDNHPKLCHD